jgi:hypothetical protein
MRIITPSKGLRNKINFSDMKNRIFYVAKSESSKYKDLGLNVIEAPDDLCRSQMRRLVIDNETEPFFMIDDDIDKFLYYNRYENDKPIYEELSVKQACEHISNKIKEYNLTDKVIVDFGNKYARLNCEKEFFHECANVFKAFYINPNILKQLNVNFPDYESQDDLELCLRLWELGKNIPVKYSLLKPNLIFESDKNSITWVNNKRTKNVCESYLRWGEIISLKPFKNGYKKGLRASVTPQKLRKHFNDSNGFILGNKKIYDPKLKNLIEKEKYDEVYDYINESENL